MKATLRIPVEEVNGQNISMWSYLEVEVEASDLETAIERAKQARVAISSPIGGLPHLEWNRVLDEYIENGNMLVEDHEKMSQFQSWMIHEWDKFAKGLDYRGRLLKIEEK